jgi:signal peptidase I
VIPVTSLAGRWGSRGGQLLLTLTAIVGGLCALLAVLAVVLGVRPIVFRSGSMEPAVGTGALGFSRSTAATDLKVGDIVTVTNAQRKTITHRIVAIGPLGDSATLRLKGDGNPVPDQEIYKVSKAPKLWFSVPDGGYVIAWFSKAPGSYLLGGYVVLMLMLAFRRREEGSSDDGSVVADEADPVTEPGTEAATPSQRTRRGPYAVATAGAIVALGVAVVSGWSQTTWAAWNDSAAVTGTTITTGNFAVVVPPAPTITGCTPENGNTASNITWTWANTSPATLPADTQFQITYSNFVGATLPSPATQDLADNVSPYAGTTVAYNDSSGDFVLTVTTPGGTSVASNKFHFAGKNAGKTCVQVP